VGAQEVGVATVTSASKDSTVKGFTLDTGALIALERGDRDLELLLNEVREDKLDIVVPAGVLAQAWRGGRRQARLAKFINSGNAHVESLDDLRARHAGELCGRTGTTDVVDASVVLCARNRKHAVITSDPKDIRRLDPDVEIVDV
jgi:hypothetical protein